MFRKFVFFLGVGLTALSAFADGPDVNCQAGLTTRGTVPKRHYWTETEVINVFKALTEKGLSTNPMDFLANESEEINAVISEIIQFKTDAKKFYYACLRLFGSFEAARKAAGLEAMEGRKSVQWKYVDAKPIFLELAKARIPLTQAAILRHYEKQVTEIVSKILKAQVSAAAFFMGMRNLHKTWDAARDANAPALLPDPLLEMLRFLSANEVSLNIAEFLKSSETVRQLTKEKGKEIGPATIHNLAIEYFGGWKEAKDLAFPERVFHWDHDRVIEVLKFLASNQVPLDEYDFKMARKRVRELTLAEYKKEMSPEEIINAAREHVGGLRIATKKAGYRVIPWGKPFIREVLTFLATEGVRLEAAEFLASSVDVRRLTNKKLGYEISPRAIFDKSIEWFDSWKVAKEGIEEKPRVPEPSLTELATQPIEPSTVEVPTINWSFDQVIEVLEFLVSRKVDLALRKFKKEWARIRKLTEMKYGVAIGPLEIIEAAKQHVGSWKAAKDEVLEGSPQFNRGIQWGPGLVIGMLQFLKSKNVDLSYNSFIGKSKLVRRLTKAEYGVTFGAYTLMKQSKIHVGKGSWKQAVEIALPDLKDRTGPVKQGNIAIIPHVLEFRSDGGKVRAEKQYGAAPVTPEEALIETDEVQNVHRAVEELQPELKQISEALLGYLEDNDDLSKRVDVLSFIELRTGRAATWWSVQRALDAMSGNLAQAAE